MIFNNYLRHMLFFSATEAARTSGAGNEETGNNLWILGPALAAVLLIVIIAVICLVWRR